ncbi:hypothetical protein BC332_23850 [Capsicum chinense]|nr:hypothetical protein BC332_23850 [Capsicum chinense]
MLASGVLYDKKVSPKLKDSGRYKDFPWDSLSFEDLARSLNNQLKAGCKFYLIQEMSLAIQVWLYECCSNVPPKIASKDPSPKKINEHSKKKQKVDSSTPVVKKPSWKKQVNIVDEHTQMRTPTPRAAKAVGMKTPIFKSIPTRQVAYSKTKKEKQTTRVIFPQVQSKADSHIKEVAVSKPKSHVEKEAFISNKIFDAFCAEQQHEDTDLEAQHMDYAGVKISPQQFSSTVDHNLSGNQDATKGCTDLHPDKINIEIDSQHLILDELLQSINLDYNLFEKIVHHVRQIDVCFYYLRKKSKYDLNSGRICAHLNEYINGFRMHAAVPWHMVEDIYILFNIKEKCHWVLAFLSFSERFIFLYDSYESSGHYSAVFAEIEKLAAIIPLCLQQPDFYIKKGIDVENHSRYKDKDSSHMFDVLFQENLPQQSSESLDCGLYMVTYAECLPYDHKVLANEFDPNALRIRYAALLWDYETQKQDTNAHSDVEEPLRPARQSRITSVTEVFDDAFGVTIPNSIQEAIDALLFGLSTPSATKALDVGTPNTMSRSQWTLPDSQFLSNFPDAQVWEREAAKAPVKRDRKKSRVFRSPYVTKFGSRSKDEGNSDNEEKRSTLSMVVPLTKSCLIN